jgi:hypothetical protein
MPTSGTKWPQGYKGFVSATKPAAPILTLVSVNAGSIVLSWTVINSDCIPISSFNIYQNGILIANILYPIDTIIINNLLSGNYNFYVISISDTVESEKSNTVSATVI